MSAGGPGTAAGVPLRADAVIVAAGSSRRMDGIDKVAAPVGGLPLIARTLAAIAAAPVIDRIVVVTARERVAWFEGAPWLPARVVAVVAGGARRQESVAAGVRALVAIDAAGGPHARPDGDDGVVIVHDGARPLVPPALVEAVASAAAAGGAAIPVVMVAETLKRVDGGMVRGTVDRNGLATAQTPQGVRRSLLARAWAAYPPEGAREFTDEAALLEACRIGVHALPGEPANLKVTLPDDLRRVERALEAAPFRIGFGHDSHPFGPGTPLRLGGVEIPGAPRLWGHSDGDVALHAVADALLGAAGLGDLGRLFPADGRTPRGVASTELLAEVRRRLEGAGCTPLSVDLTVIGARPRLGSGLDAMRTAIAGVLGLAEDRVNVKASTGNLSGDEGAGRSMSARAVAVVGVAA